MSELVLASASATRAMLLSAAGVRFRVAPADLNEPALIADLAAENADGATIAVTLAEQKAVAVSRRTPGAMVLGGDSVLAFGTEIISKCPDMPGLRLLLKRLAGQTHFLFSAACLARDGAVLWHHTSRARLTMRAFSDAFLDGYLAAEGEALLASVGGYRFEDRGAQLFTDVEGDYFSILGLPLLPVLAALRSYDLVAS